MMVVVAAVEYHRAPNAPMTKLSKDSRARIGNSRQTATGTSMRIDLTAVIASPTLSTSVSDSARTGRHAIGAGQPLPGRQPPPHAQAHAQRHGGQHDPHRNVTKDAGLPDVDQEQQRPSDGGRHASRSLQADFGNTR